MDRITTAQLAATFEQFRSANRKAGIVRQLHPWNVNDHSNLLTADNLAMQIGSKTYGNAFRVFYINPDGGGHFDLSSFSDYLGMTKREAYNTLRAMTTGILAVIDAQNGR